MTILEWFLLVQTDKGEEIEMSRRLGFLTGMESEVMLDAHVQATFMEGMPFSKPGGFDFPKSNITQSISSLRSTMLKHRLTPPPDEAYSLHIRGISWYASNWELWCHVENSFFKVFIIIGSLLVVSRI